jgi:Barstar (barnase inhibitor)
MYTVNRFEFLEDINIESAVVLTKNIESRKQLFDAIANGLRFPDYFGGNWDALIDCLSDLSWLDQDEVVLAHASLPSLGGRELRVYLECLVDAAARRAPDDRPKLRLIFRRQDGQKIEDLFAEDDSSSTS